eukprot:1195611-Prorocentrum_minimum.AAC.4
MCILAPVGTFTLEGVETRGMLASTVAVPCGTCPVNQVRYLQGNPASHRPPESTARGARRPMINVSHAIASRSSGVGSRKQGV